MNYFCGYPVIDPAHQHKFITVFKPCGKLATPGCAFCDEHGEALEQDSRLVRDSLANDTGHGPFFGSPAPLLTEQDIVDRAAARARRAENRKTIYWSMIYGAMACGLMLAFYQPVHTWLRGYAEFLIGVFVGSSIEAVMWIWERVKRWR